MFSIELDEGVRLFALEPHHAQEFHAHIDRGREFIGRHVGFPDRATDTASARRLLEDFARRAAADTGRMYGIRADGVLVGGVLFPSFDARNGTCEIGCWVEPAAAGRGLVTRACRVLIDWAFHERGMRRVEWHADSANEKSLAVAARLGMTREGVLRENYLHRGQVQDTEIWSVLAREWPART
ncbi:GNAT family protein [Streptomyces sp. NPDC097619]|uniref:GNAT family N-acetyltransferase n=1 Tax=Streptomyces sp. NPDC097619 TaxID=3157228 RepID=UPI00332CAADD